MLSRLRYEPGASHRSPHKQENIALAEVKIHFCQLVRSRRRIFHSFNRLGLPSKKIEKTQESSNQASSAMSQECRRKAADSSPEYSSRESASLSILAKDLQLVADRRIPRNCSGVLKCCELLTVRSACLTFMLRLTVKSYWKLFLDPALRECIAVSYETRQMEITAVTARSQTRLHLMLTERALLLKK